jgi:Fic family protein
MKDPYIPEELPIRSINWVDHITAIGQANSEIARYDGILQGIVNPQILLSPLSTREAVISSRIEGTQASLEEVMHFEANDNKQITPEKRDDISEIINYRRAVYTAIEQLKSKPLCINSIRELHKILLTSARGKDKEPGEIRRTQNYIGSYGATGPQVSFVPPSPLLVMDALTKWETYLHQPAEKDSLVQTAILKAQFELIHPFRDGNGRIGRMLVPLILYYKKHLSQPLFYISSYLESNRKDYYACLQGISEEKDWNSWITFFLQAIIEQARENNKKAKSILDLYNKIKVDMPDVTGSKYGIQAIDTIFSRPVFSSTYFYGHSGIPKQTAHRILAKLTESEVVKVGQEGSGSRAGVYVFPELIGIVDSF